MSRIGYIRVSTEHQETARQQKIMCDYQVDRIFSEKISGANKDRPQLKAMLDYNIADYSALKFVRISFKGFGDLSSTSKLVWYSFLQNGYPNAMLAI